MSFKEVLDYESALTKPIRDEVYAFEQRVNAHLNELVMPWEGDLEDEEDEEEEEE